MTAPRPDLAEEQRLAIEAELTAAQLEALVEMCRALGIRPERWREVAGFRVFEVAAVLQRAERLRGQRELSETKSIEVAAPALGATPINVRQTRLRWQKAARRNGSGDS